MKLANPFKKKIVEKPLVSVIGTAVRTQLWKDFYKCFKNNSTPFEVVFVGDKKPSFTLPYNFRFIYSKAKPVQCLEIASRNAKGEFLLVTADDCILSTRAIDILYAQFKRLKNNKVILSGRWYKKGKAIPLLKHRFTIGDLTSPLIPVNPFLRKTYWDKLGGLDKRFIATCADIDLVMRAYEDGGEVKLNNNVRYEEWKNKRAGINLYPEFGASIDRPTLNSFWIKKNNLSKKRLKPFQPFKEKGLLEFSQGAKGKWI